MVPTAANGQPALAEYARGADGIYRAFGIQVLTIAGSRIARISAFLDPSLFEAFGLPTEL
jgi:RNA polymerase sigma-70 factor (ECF subfamily)